MSLPLPVPAPVTPIEAYQAAVVASQAQPSATSHLTILVLRGGRVYLVSEYWVNNEDLNYTTGGGAPQALPLDVLDIPLTKRLNAERGMPFVLTAKSH